ncbi:MAG TPA: hypothetical protein VGL86_02700, partial [Polyangia bacterium]
MRVVAGVTCLVAVASAARAAPDPGFALAYEAPAGAGCPTEAALRASVAGELGYDPWDPVDDGSSPRIVVVIHATKGGVRGRVEMRAPDGRRLGAREIEAARCGELSQTLELAIAVAIDPLRAAVLPAPRHEPPPSTKPPPTAVTPPLAPLVVATPMPPRFVDGIHLRVAFGV